MDKQLSIYDGDSLTIKETMTVKEVAEVLAVSESTILRYIKKVFPDRLKSGEKTFLSERDVTIMKLKLQQNQHLVRPEELPKTELEENLLIQQAQNILLQRIDKLQAKLEEAKPKIEFYDKVGDSDGLHTVAEAAKMLGTGRNRLFSWMRSYKILRQNNEPYQKYLEAKYFDVKESPDNNYAHMQTFVTPTGLQWLQKLREKNLIQMEEWARQNSIPLFPNKKYIESPEWD